MSRAVRTHILVDRDLLEAVDALAGDRGRSEFIEAALREKLARERMGRALSETAGSLSLADHPEWSNPEAISAWVHNLRRENSELPMHTRIRG